MVLLNYKIHRQINNSGHLVSVKLDQVKQNVLIGRNEKSKPDYRSVISGERKQLGESVVGEIETILGINYQKLQIASIIQQGEINKIIDSQPKEFKELLNTMMGLDRLDTSFAYMHSIIDEFRNSLREKTGGYYDHHINMLITKAEENRNRVEKSKISLNTVYSDLSKITDEMLVVEKEIDDLEPKISKLQEIRALETTLLKYLKEKSIH